MARSVLDTMLAGYDDESAGDEIGYDEIGYDEIGAAQPRKRRGGGRLPPQAPGAPPRGVSRTQPELRRLFCGITITSIAAAGSATVTVTVGEPFKLDKLILSTAAQGLHLTNISVGTKSMNVGSGSPVPGNAFAEGAFDNQITGYTAEPGQNIVVQATNNTAGALSLSGVFFGWTAV